MTTTQLTRVYSLDSNNALLQAALSFWRLNSPFSAEHFNNLPVPQLQQFLRDRGQVVQRSRSLRNIRRVLAFVHVLG